MLKVVGYGRAVAGIVEGRSKLKTRC